jgi:rubrerythrin
VDYLNEEEEGVTIGVGLFVDGVLTSTVTTVGYQKPEAVPVSILRSRLQAAVRLSLQERGVADMLDVADSVQKGLEDRGWLAYFVDMDPSQLGEEGGWTVVGGLSPKFDRALDEETQAYREHRSAQARETRLAKLDTLQQAQAEAAFAYEQVALLQTRVSELEDLHRRERQEHQAQLAHLRLQLQLSKATGGAAEWICPVCTFVNPVANALCSMCQAPKTRASPQEEEAKHEEEAALP